VQEAVLRDGDVIELGRGGPRLKFQAADRRPRAHEDAHHRRISDTLAMRMVLHHTSRPFRRALAVVLALSLLGLGAVLAWTQRESRRLRAQMADLRGEMERAEQKRRQLEGAWSRSARRRRWS
jgi:hypothetical protein